MTICPVSKSDKTVTRLTNTADPITSYASVEARLATRIKDKRKNKVKVTRLSICNVALEIERTLCGGIPFRYFSFFLFLLNGSSNFLCSILLLLSSFQGQFYTILDNSFSPIFRLPISWLIYIFPFVL